MTSFAQGAEVRTVAALFVLEPSGTMRPDPSVPADVQGLLADESTPSAGTHVSNDEQYQATPGNTYPAQEVDDSSAGFDWFEKPHVIPRDFDYGNILSDQSTPIEVFNAHRRKPDLEWTSFTSNAGAGVMLTVLPTLPTDIAPMNGVVMTLDVDTIGAAIVDTTLDFVFSAITIQVAIEIQRIVLWGAVPDQPYTESLAFRTNIYETMDGTEKRERTRRYPRQSWAYTYKIDEGIGAQILDNLLFDYQARNWGNPVYEFESLATAAVTAGDTVITVDSTAYRDYRVGRQIVLLTDQGTFDVLTIASGGITATTLTVTSPVVNSYAVGTTVYPMAVSRINGSVRGGRYSHGLRTESINFEAVNNVVDLADLSAFSEYKGKLLLDQFNVVLSSTTGHEFKQLLTRIDGEVGGVFQDSTWDRNKRGHLFTMRAHGLQETWEMRGMIYAIGGSHTSFYVPTSSDDLVVTADLQSGGAGMTVTNVGYASFVRNRQPRSDIRVTFVDGSTPLVRGIIGSVNTSSTVEDLTMDANWPSTITPAEIARVEYVEKVRFASDTLKIEHRERDGLAYMRAPVVSVFE